MLRNSSRSLEAQRQYIINADVWARATNCEYLIQEFELVRRYLWFLDLARAWSILSALYHTRGRPACDPLLLLAMSLVRRILKIDSRDDFIAKLRLTPYLQRILGITNGIVPGASTLRDFEKRTTPVRKRSVRLPKKKSRGSKDGLIKRAASFILRLGRQIPGRPNSTTTLTRLLQTIGFVPAKELGIIPERPRAAMVDGSYMDSRTNGAGKKTCQHGRKKCDCPRVYTDPLARSP